MNSSELLERFRLEVDDLEDPPLWSDAEIYAFLDDAQKEFCRRTFGIEDAQTASVCRVDIVPGTEWYPKSPLILKIRSASRADNGRPVEVMNLETALKRGCRFDGRPGPARVLVDGVSKSSFRAHPLPNDAVSVDLVVFRLPLVRITDAGDQELEIDEQHHVHLLLWMCHLAFLKQDADTLDVRRGIDYQNRFWAYCTTAKAEQQRSVWQTGTVAYGGY